MEVPARPAAADIYDIAPDDADEERRRREADEFARQERWKLLQHRAPPEEAPAKRSPLADDASVTEDDMVQPSDLRQMLADYLEAAAAGRLEQARDTATLLSRNRRDALQQIDLALQSAESLARLSTLPAPVAQGFLKQLRKRLAPA